MKKLLILIITARYLCAENVPLDTPNIEPLTQESETPSSATRPKEKGSIFVSAGALTAMPERSSAVQAQLEPSSYTHPTKVVR